MIRKALPPVLGAICLVLLTPAVWLLLYHAAGLPLPVGTPPELDLTLVRDAGAGAGERKPPRNVNYLLERSLVRTAFELIPTETLPSPRSADSEWRSEVWPPVRALDDSALAGHARLMAFRIDRECTREGDCRIVQTLFARLVVLAAGGASAELSLEWQAHPDSADRGWARMQIVRAGESWRLARFDVLSTLPTEWDSGDAPLWLFPARTGYVLPRR